MPRVINPHRSETQVAVQLLEALGSSMQGSAYGQYLLRLIAEES